MKQMITIIMAVVTTVLSMAQTGVEQDLLKAFNTNVPKELKDNVVPGLAVAIIQNGEVIIKKGYGVSDKSASIEVNEKTGFNIGSISKMFTAWGIMKLVEEQKVDLDAPVSKYLKRWKLPQSEFLTNKVTVRNLLQHTAGLSVHGYNGYNSKKELTSLTASLNGSSNSDEKVELIMEPETKWKYSGGGYTILQLLIEDVSGMTFANYMQKLIFKPLKMKHTSFTIDSKVLKNSAKAYDEEGKEIALRLFNAQAAAGLHTTLNDLILFAKASFKSNAVLSKSSIEKLITPTELSHGDYGMGYMVMNRFGDFTLSGHGGSNEGWQSGFLLDFKSQSGIIILTNGSNGRNVLFATMKDWATWYGKK